MNKPYLIDWWEYECKHKREENVVILCNSKNLIII